KQAPLLSFVPLAGSRIGPLHPAAAVEHPVVVDASDVARLAAGELLEHLEHLLWAAPTREHLAAAPVVGNQAKNMKIGQRLSGGGNDLLDDSNPPLRVDEGPFLFPPACC